MAIEEQLNAFQESKIRHHKNLERLRILQEVDLILVNPIRSTMLLTKKILELELLGLSSIRILKLGKNAWK
jgi:hypothetical protein